MFTKAPHQTSSPEIRALSVDELESVAGGAGFFESMYDQAVDILHGPQQSMKPYVDAFLKGVEQGKQKCPK